MKRLSKRQIQMLHTALIEEFGGSDGLRDEALLDSAVNAPFRTFSDQDLYPSLVEKAARLCYGLVKNHPFIDGNKRIGAHCPVVFLELNNYVLDYTDNELIHIILSIADGTKDDNDLVYWIQDHLT